MDLRKFVEALTWEERHELWNVLNPDKIMTPEEIAMDFIPAIKAVMGRLGLNLGGAKRLVEKERGGPDWAKRR